MKTAQKISRKLEQNLTVITFYEAIYSKGKEIQWHVPSEFHDVILRLGEFHIALNFLGVIGTKYPGSGLEDIMIESGVYGSNSIGKILKGKTYNRGVRAHKILFEALTRLRWDLFVDWLVSQDNVEFYTREINQLLVACQNLDRENFQQCIFRLSQLLDPVVSTQVLSQLTI